MKSLKVFTREKQPMDHKVFGVRVQEPEELFCDSTDVISREDLRSPSCQGRGKTSQGQL